MRLDQNPEPSKLDISTNSADISQVFQTGIETYDENDLSLTHPANLSGFSEFDKMNSIHAQDQSFTQSRDSIAEEAFFKKKILKNGNITYDDTGFSDIKVLKRGFFHNRRISNARAGKIKLISAIK